MGHTQSAKGNTNKMAGAVATRRSTGAVFEDHLRLWAAGDLKEDIRRNHADDVVLMHVHGIEHGHLGVRKSGHRLRRQLPVSSYEYVSKMQTIHYTLGGGEE